MPFKYDNMEARIIANTVLSRDSYFDGTPCWEWIGAYAINRSGMHYGKLSIRAKRGPRKGKPVTHLVHRLVLVVFKGRRMTPRMVARHRCNNTICCNPAHLLGGTQVSNVRQCVREGRHRNMHSKATA